MKKTIISVICFVMIVAVMAVLCRMTVVEKRYTSGTGFTETECTMTVRETVTRLFTGEVVDVNEYNEVFHGDALDKLLFHSTTRTLGFR